MRFRACIWLLINMLAMYGKSLPAVPDEVSSMDLAINLKSLIAPFAPGDMIYICFLRVTAEAGHHQEGAGVQERYANAHPLEVSSQTSKLQLQLYLEGLLVITSA